MRDAILAHQFFETGQLRELWGDDPPAHLPRAVSIHHQAISVTIDHDRPKPRAPGAKPQHRGDPMLPDGGDRP